jgi:hypothetical protein
MTKTSTEKPAKIKCDNCNKSRNVGSKKCDADGSCIDLEDCRKRHDKREARKPKPEFAVGDIVTTFTPLATGLYTFRDNKRTEIVILPSARWKVEEVIRDGFRKPRYVISIPNLSRMQEVREIKLKLIERAKYAS